MVESFEDRMLFFNFSEEMSLGHSTDPSKSFTADLN
jgi:hypothetical protein